MRQSNPKTNPGVIPEASRPLNSKGRAMTLGDLPPPDAKRWVVKRKAQVVSAVRTGIITLDEACDRYTLSVEEFLSWQRLIDKHGLRGLRATRVQDYRRDENRTWGKGPVLDEE